MPGTVYWQQSCNTYLWSFCNENNNMSNTKLKQKKIFFSENLEYIKNRFESLNYSRGQNRGYQ
jgi:hypothetical protein